MRRHWAPIICLLVAGCGAPSATPLDKAAGSEVGAQTAERISDDEFNIRTRLSIVNGDGKHLRVGDREALVSETFDKPKSATVISEPPPSLPVGFSVWGWIADDEGFGALMASDSKGDLRTAAAMRQFPKLNEARLQELVNSYQMLFGKPTQTIDGRRVRYWFWEDPPHRLAICSVNSTDSNRFVTLALGEDTLMSRLRLDPEIAQRDGSAAEQIFEQKKTIPGQTRKTS